MTQAAAARQASEEGGDRYLLGSGTARSKRFFWYPLNSEGFPVGMLSVMRLVIPWQHSDALCMSVDPLLKFLVVFNDLQEEFKWDAHFGVVDFLLHGFPFRGEP